MIDEAKKLDGTRIGKEIQAEVAAGVAALAVRGVVPRLDVVLVGEDPASQVYVGSKAATCERLGMGSEVHRLPADTSQAELENLVALLNADPEVDGILVQLPLPAGLDAHAVIERIDPAKDVDGLTATNAGLLLQGRPRLVPCTPAGVMEMLRREQIDVRGLRAAVVGRSEIVGKPMALLLLHAHATVTICHSRTTDLAAVTREADLVVAAVGRLALLGADHIRAGAVVVDVGMHRVTDRATVERLYPGNDKKLRAFERTGAVLSGDVDIAAIASKAARITPVPGGVGPLTIAMLMANTLTAATLRRGL